MKKNVIELRRKERPRMLHRKEPDNGITVEVRALSLWERVAEGRVRAVKSDTCRYEALIRPSATFSRREKAPTSAVVTKYAVSRA